jgi:hypothetical protein
MILIEKVARRRCVRVTFHDKEVRLLAKVELLGDPALLYLEDTDDFTSIDAPDPG